MSASREFPQPVESSKAGDLPDISALATLERATWRAFGLRLAAIGFGPALCASMWCAPPHSYPGLHWPILEWRAHAKDDPAGTVYRLFCLGHRIADSAAVAALTAPLFTAVLDGGLLERREPGFVDAKLQLRAYHDLFILSDDLTRAGDAVFGVGGGNQAFGAIVSERWPARSAVDIGCGAGTAALAISRHVDSVVATDINRRAIDLARVNAAINGVTNIDFRVGDLFQPVAGECFDLIISQPPFVPHPSGVDEARYLFGGELGVEIASRIFGEVQEHLADGGRAAIVYEAPVTGRAGDIDPWLALPTEDGVGRLRLLGCDVSADVYSLRLALPSLRKGVQQFDAAVVAMRSHLDALGVSSLRPAVAVWQRRVGGPGWSETFRANGNLWDQMDHLSIRRLLRSFSVIHEGAQSVLEATVAVPEGTLVVEAWGSSEALVNLVLPFGYLGGAERWRRDELALLGSRRATDEARPGCKELEVRKKALRAGLFAGNIEHQTLG